MERSKEKVLFFHPFSLQNPNFVTVLDHALEVAEMDREKEVHLYKCNGELKFCQQNPRGNKLICELCKNTFDTFLKYFDKNNLLAIVEFKHLIFFENEYLLNTLKELDSFNKLRNLSVTGINIGSGVLSSYFDITRNDNWSELNRPLLNSLVFSSIISLEVGKKLFNEFNFKEIFIFNGRLHDNKPILNFFVSKNVNYVVLETTGGRVKNSYKKHVFLNSRPHSITTYGEHVILNWEKSDEQTQKKIIGGNSFYLKKYRGESIGDKSYTKNQKSNINNFRLSSHKTKIVIFNSSPDEIFSLGDEWVWDFEGYTSQAEVISFICDRILSEESTFQIILRSHPNLKKYRGKESLIYEDLAKKYKDFIYISSESKENSYELMKIADYVITFGSTMGIEASYFKKNSLLIGKSFYYNLNVVFSINSMLELWAILKGNINTFEKINYENVIKFGYYLTNKKYSVFSFYRVFPTHNLLDGIMHYSLVKNTKFSVKLKFFIFSILVRILNLVKN